MDGENTQETPAGNPPVDERQKKVTETVDKMRELGIDPNAFITLLIPIMERFNNDAAAKMRQELKSQVDAIGTSIFEKINAEADRKVASMKQNQQVPEQQPPVQEVIQNPAQQQNPGRGGGFNPMANPDIMSLLAKMLGGGQQQGDVGSSLKQMAETAKVFGTFYSEMMQPLVDIQAKMRQNVLAEMTTYSKTGGQLPWDEEEEKPARQTHASLNQDERNKRISDLAKRIRLT